MSKVASLIAEARALDAAASPAPWLESEADDFAGGDSCGGIYSAAGTRGEIVTTDGGYYGPKRADANFIMRSRTLLVELADALERARQGAIDECAAYLDHVAKVCRSYDDDGILTEMSADMRAALGGKRTCGCHECEVDPRAWEQSHG